MYPINAKPGLVGQVACRVAGARLSETSCNQRPLIDPCYTNPGLQARTVGTLDRPVRTKLERQQDAPNAGGDTPEIP